MSRTQPINVQRKVKAIGVPAPATLRKWALVALEDTDGDLTIRIVDEAESAALNARFRNRPEPTNVLSFGYEAEALDEPTLGDLVICAPIVAREAAAQGKDPRSHWAHMVVHGVLHLRGHDHEREEDAAVMETLEREILASLGFGNPYCD